MERLFALIVSFVLLSSNVSILNSWDIQPTQIQKVYKIIRLSGLSELATLPNNDIIPVFQFALPSIPDSEWEQLRKKYDSSNVVKEMADSLRKKFTQEEIDGLYDLFEPFERMKIEYEPNESPISNFDLTLKYFKGLDSLWSLIDKVDWKALDSILAKGILLNSIFGDSVTLKFMKKLSKKGSKAKDAGKSTTRMEKQKAKSSVTDTLVEHRLLSVIDLWTKATQQFIGAYKDYLNVLLEHVKTQLQGKNDNKEFDKLLKEMEKKLQRIQKEFERKSKELQKKYQKEADKIQKELEKLEKRMEQRGNEINEELEAMPDSLFEKYENGWDKYFQKSKELFDKYYRFFKEYRYFRKELEKRILEELKQRGFIQE